MGFDGFAGGDQFVGKEGALDVEELAFEFLRPAFGIVDGGAEFVNIDGEAVMEGAVDVNEMATPLGGRDGRDGRGILTPALSFKERGNDWPSLLLGCRFFPIRVIRVIRG
jgi:hypothetical protein